MELPLTFLIVWVCRRWVSLAFVCLKKTFISPLFLEGIFPGYRILDWQEFFPLTWKLLFCCLLACRMSNRKSAFIYIFVSLYIMSLPFHPSCFLIFSLSLVLGNRIVMYLGTVIFIFLILGTHWDSWISRFLVFIKFRKCSAIISSNNFFSLPPPLCSYTHIKLLEIFPRLTDAVFIVFLSFFSLCFILDGFYCYVLKITDLLFWKV